MIDRVKTVYESRLDVLYKIMRTIPSHGRVILADLVEAFVTVGILMGILLPVGLKLSDSMQVEIFAAGGAIFLMALRSFVIIRLRGVGLGFLLFGIRYVDLNTGKYITTSDYRDFFFQSIWIGLKFSNLGESVSFLQSDQAQTIAMQEMGIVYVVRSRFQKYLKDHPVQPKV